MAKKIDKSTVDAIRSLLRQYDVKEEDRIVIDLKNSMISDYKSELLSGVNCRKNQIRAAARNESESESS